MSEFTAITLIMSMSVLVLGGLAFFLVSTSQGRVKRKKNKKGRRELQGPSANVEGCGHMSIFLFFGTHCVRRYWEPPVVQGATCLWCRQEGNDLL
ncbi:hypothetical protein L211DRAFT_677083 [Terfezia boudieri ATCC MYA-4762]|uniref:Uncharacterized protein n=1 Tax=Terfezia boudieri ATCC MYA-4762 TaxID=1051890 RepID=A0A3N4M9J5_9PEZI|nr:hypothetical protein L211DRAFT_677083 [Terfezia boudieri ATCC MYA-4762]